MSEILIINAHPNPQSLCHNLTDAYEAAARKNPQNTIHRLNLYQLQFNPNMLFGYRQNQELEPDLIQAQNLIKSSQHIVFIYPNWWGSMPALLKGFIDRTFLPGFAFKYTNKPFPDKLLQGKTSEILITMDTPVWFYKLFMSAAGIKIMTQAILKFCGIQNKRVSYFSPIRGSTPDVLKKYISRANVLGSKLP